MLALLAAAALAAADAPPASTKPPAEPGSSVASGAAPAASLPQAAPAPPEPPRLYFAGEYGMRFMAGEIGHDVLASTAFGPQTSAGLQLGLRVTPELVLGVSGAFGGGDPGPEVRAGTCGGAGCRSNSWRAGVLVRSSPMARSWSIVLPWAALESGVEHGEVRDGDRRPLMAYTGWQAMRLSFGADMRPFRTIAWGFYAAFNMTYVLEYDDGTTTHSYSLADSKFSSGFELGVRMAFGP